MNLPVRSHVAVVTISEFKKEKRSWKVIHHGKTTFSLNVLSRQIHLITKSNTGQISTWNIIGPFKMQGPSSFVMEARVMHGTAKPQRKPIAGVHFGSDDCFKEFAVFLNPKNDPKLQSHFFIHLEKFHVIERIQSPKKHPDVRGQAQLSSPTTPSQQAPLVRKTKSQQSTSLPRRANETSDIPGGHTNSIQMIAHEAKSDDMTRIRITRPDTNESYVLDIFRDSSILGVKIEVWNRSRITPERQTLVFAGKVLDDDETIHRLQIKSGERITLYSSPPPEDHLPPPQSHRPFPMLSRQTYDGFAGDPEMSNDRGYPSPLSFQTSTPTVYDSHNVLSVHETTNRSAKTLSTTIFPDSQPNTIDDVPQEMQGVDPLYPQLSHLASSPIAPPKKPKSTPSKQRPITNWFPRTSQSPSGSRQRARSRSHSRSRSRSRSRDRGGSAARSSSRGRERKRDRRGRGSATKQTTLLDYRNEIDDAFATPPPPQQRRRQHGPSEVFKGRVLDSLDNSMKTVEKSVDTAHGGISSVDSGIDLLKKTLDC